MEVEINDDAEARQRFESSLPENWVLCSSKTHSGRLYYFNSVTGESRWQHPLLPDMDAPVSLNIIFLSQMIVITKGRWKIFIPYVMIVGERIKTNRNQTQDLDFPARLFSWASSVLCLIQDGSRKTRDYSVLAPQNTPALQATRHSINSLADEKSLRAGQFTW